jgi:glycosyltransferase involved in cell wall biosynthesis
MPGAVSNPYAYMRRAGMFVLPSRFEGLPNVLIEAMCCETPVIATNCRSGITEIVADGKTGLLCKDNDAADLASKISLLLGNKDLRGRLTEAALRSVRETFAMPLMIERYRKLIYERDH